MRLLRLIFLALLCLGLFVVAGSLRSPTARANGPHVDLVTFDREVDPASARFFEDAIDTAQGMAHCLPSSSSIPPAAISTR